MSATDLADAMNERRLELGLRWVHVARRANNMDVANLRRIRRGEIALTEFSARSLDHALEWPAGHAMSLHQRGDLTARSSSSTDSYLFKPPGPGEEPDLWDETEREIWAITELDEQLRAAYINRRRRRLHARKEGDANGPRETA